MEKSGKRQTGKKIAVLGILAGLGLAAFLLESLIPIPFLPGAKLGFANIFSLTALLLYGLPEALAVVLVRTVLGSLRVYLADKYSLYDKSKFDFLWVVDFPLLEYD